MSDVHRDWTTEDERNDERRCQADASPPATADESVGRRVDARGAVLRSRGSTKDPDYIDLVGTVWVEGEITQWGTSAGTSTASSRISTRTSRSFTIWSSARSAIPDDLKHGDHVVRPASRPTTGSRAEAFTLQVSSDAARRPRDLLERLERLRTQLAGEGLFDLSRKKPLPFLPHCIGLITGKDSDAEKDILRNAQLRWPAVTSGVHAAVQGDRPRAEVTAAIKRSTPTPRSTSSSSPAVAATSRISLASATSASSGPRPRRPPRWSARSGTKPTVPSSTTWPTCGPPPRRMPPSGSSRTSPRALPRRGRRTPRLSMKLAYLLTHGDREDPPDPLTPRPGRIRASSTPAPQELTRYVAMDLEPGRTHARPHALPRDRPTCARTLRALSPQRTLDRGYAIAQRPDGHILRPPPRMPPSGTPFTLYPPSPERPGSPRIRSPARTPTRPKPPHPAQLGLNTCQKPPRWPASVTKTPR